MVTSLVVRDSELFAASGNRLYAFRTACTHAGTPCPPDWIGRTPGWIDGFVVAGGSVYSSDSANVLSVFPVACGRAAAVCRPAWQISGLSTGGNPSVAGGLLYEASPTRVEAFDATCGRGGHACRPLWSSPTRGTVAAAPLAVHGVVYAGDESGYVYAFGHNGTATLAAVAPTGAPGRVGSDPASGGSVWFYLFYLAVFVSLGALLLRARRRREASRP